MLWIKETFELIFICPSPSDLLYSNRFRSFLTIYPTPVCSYQSIYQSTPVCSYLSIYPTPVCSDQSIYQFTPVCSYLSIYLSILPQSVLIYLSIYPTPVCSYQSIYLAIHFSLFFSINPSQSFLTYLLKRIDVLPIIFFLQFLQEINDINTCLIGNSTHTYICL